MLLKGGSLREGKRRGGNRNINRIRNNKYRRIYIRIRTSFKNEKLYRSAPI